MRPTPAPLLPIFALVGTAAALHGSSRDAGRPPRTCASAHGPGSGRCVAPGTCVPPAEAHFSAVADGPSPSLQWDLSGGFCGAFSTQQSALSAGAYISQDLVRKANIDQPGPHFMHGNPHPANCSSDPLGCGWEVMPSNVKYTADHLRLLSDEFDYTQPSPQAAAWKKWAKSHLVKKHALAFFPMCKGDGHQPYPDSCPNGGHVDHVECAYGIFSRHPLDDPEVYPDDVILHTADQDCFPYYRRMDSLEDTPAMDGNCKIAREGFGKNEMYPCIDENVTYGLAVTGLDVQGTIGHTSMTVDFKYEPNVRTGQPAAAVHTNVTVVGLEPLKKYQLLRYIGTATLPKGPPFKAPNVSTEIIAGLKGTVSVSTLPPFMSDQAVYHFTVAATPDRS